MKVSARADYALRAVLRIAASPGGVPVPAVVIAQDQGVPLGFLRLVLSELARHGVVRAHRSHPGGYTLSRPPGELTAADVILAVEGQMATVGNQPLDALRYQGVSSSAQGADLFTL